MNPHVTLESLAQRVEALERAVGVFMKQVDEEGRKIREAERAQAQEGLIEE